MGNKRRVGGFLGLATVVAVVGGVYLVFEMPKTEPNAPVNPVSGDIVSSQEVSIKKEHAAQGEATRTESGSASVPEEEVLSHSAARNIARQEAGRSTRKRKKNLHRGYRQLVSSVDASFSTEKAKTQYYREMIANRQGVEALSIQPLEGLGVQSLQGDIMTTLSKDPDLFEDFADDLRESLVNVPGAIDQTEDYRAVFDLAQQTMDAPVSIENLQCGPVLCVARLSAENAELLRAYQQQLLSSGSHLVWQVFGGANRVDPETGRVTYQAIWSTNPDVAGIRMGQPNAAIAPPGD